MAKAFILLMLISLLTLTIGGGCFNADGLGTEPPVADAGGETGGDGGTTDDTSTTDGTTPTDDAATQDAGTTDTPPQDT